MSKNIFSTSLTSDTEIQKGGGIFSNLLGCTNLSSIVIKACKKGEFKTVSYLILNETVDDLDEVDDEGYTILHYIVGYYKEIPNADKVLDKILSDDASDFIDMKDYRNGNTALHLAVMTKNYEVANKLIKAGADTSSTNKNGFFVASESEKDINEDIVKESVFRSSSKNDTNLSIDSLVNDFFGKSASNVSPNKKAMTIESTAGPNTSEFLRNIMSDMNSPQKGGSKLTRNLNTLTENYNDDDDDDDMDDGSVLNNEMINTLFGGEFDKEASDIHKKVIAKIEDLMGVDRDTARVYRATLFYKINTDEKNKNLSEKEKALLLDDMATKDKLGEIDIEFEKEERKKRMDKKNSEKKDRPKKGKKMQKTETTLMSPTSSTIDEQSSKKETKKKEKKTTKKVAKKAKRVSETSSNTDLLEGILSSYSSEE